MFIKRPDWTKQCIFRCQMPATSKVFNIFHSSYLNLLLSSTKVKNKVNHLHITSLVSMRDWHILIAIFLIFLKASPQHLQPFVSDKNVPSELEYMIISFREPNLYLQQWNSAPVCQEIRFSSQVDCKLLECRNVTMQSVVKPFGICGQMALSSSGGQKLLDCTVILDSVLVNFGQHVVHSLSTAIQAWQQVCSFQKRRAACPSYRTLHVTTELQVRPKPECEGWRVWDHHFVYKCDTGVLFTKL